jgi:hypothetical protein
MRVAEVSSTYVRCRRWWWPIRAIGACMLCTSVALWTTRTESIGVSIAIAAAGLGLVIYDEEQSVVIDTAAGSARITNRQMGRRARVTTLPLDAIVDVAVERAPIEGARGVFVRTDGGAVPWEPWSRLTMYQSSSIALSVAAARRVGGWTVLPVEDAWGVHVPVVRTPRAEARREMRTGR